MENGAAISLPFLVLQVYVGSGPNDSFSLEIQIKDKFNSKRRIMLTQSRNEIIKNSTHIKGPSSFVRRDTWLNFCIDLDSFVSECFSN